MQKPNTALSSAAPTGINRKEDIQMQDNEQLAAGAASDLNAKLDVEDGMMCVFVDDTEISHYLMMHINDPENLQGWQNHVCQVGAETINKLREEVKRLRNKVFELDCKVKVCVCCTTAYKNGTENAEIIEKMGVCENCITDI